MSQLFYLCVASQRIQEGTYVYSIVWHIPRYNTSELKQTVLLELCFIDDMFNLNVLFSEKHFFLKFLNSSQKTNKYCYIYHTKMSIGVHKWRIMIVRKKTRLLHYPTFRQH